MMTLENFIKQVFNELVICIVVENTGSFIEIGIENKLF